MQRNALKLLVSLLYIICLTGCVAQVDQVSFSPTVEEKIYHIGIPTISSPELVVVDVENPFLSFGLIGGLFYSSEMDKNENEIYKKESKFNFAMIMQKSLAEGLASGGYVTEEIRIDRENERKFIDLTKIIKNYDAILDVVIIDNGYINASWPKNGKTDIGAFRPIFRVVAKLVSKNNKVLYSNTFMFGSHNRNLNATDINAPREYFFTDTKSMKENTEKVLIGLELAAKQVAERISLDLTKK